jgi:hypothetical protein
MLFAVAAGFDDRSVLTLQVQIAGPRYRDPGIGTPFLSGRRSTPSRACLASASAALTTPTAAQWRFGCVRPALRIAQRRTGSEDGAAFRYAISADYFETMNITHGAGAPCRNRIGAAPAGHVLINDSLPADGSRDVDLIGQRLHIGPTDRLVHSRRCGRRRQAVCRWRRTNSTPFT